MKLRKNMVVALLAGLLALSAVACESGGGTDGGTEPVGSVPAATAPVPTGT